jgi:hypothetical protein
MSCICWNCRGAGGTSTIHELVSLTQSVRPSLVFFLCETRQNKDKVRRLRNRLGLRGFAGVNSVGLSGGLALFWHESIIVDIKDMNKNYIDAYIRMSPNEPEWHLTCIYGEPRVENRHLVWSQLQNLRSSALPWLVVGDFNEALWQFEHLSHTPSDIGIPNGPAEYSTRGLLKAQNSKNKKTRKPI